MKFAYSLDGSAPFIKKYKLGASIIAGVPACTDASNDYGEIIPCSTTAAADTFGVTLDGGTYTATQSSTMVEGVASVIINPHAVYKALMSGGATENTALTAYVADGADSGGDDFADTTIGSYELQGGTCWGLSGANAGVSRHILDWDTGATIEFQVPFPNGILVTDTYAMVPWSIVVGNVQLTTLLTQADASIAVGTGIEATIVELELKGVSDSFIYFQLADHVFNLNTI